MKKARRQAGAAVVIAASTLVVVAALIVAFWHQLVGYAGAQGETARLAARYLAITIPSLVPMSAALVMSGTLRADGYGAKAMYITLFPAWFCW
ncbi:MATE family efflux transporter [Sulfitobacter sp.]|uniref:MATE family efflux transporter n=1 Tax=Sulfitobacter sp. TaxID=1903071 RepID=UPI003001BDB2